MGEARSGDGTLWLVASVLASVTYWFARDVALPIAVMLAWKVLPVGLLALWAWLSRQGGDARPLALVMALSAAGDVALELVFYLGALFFILSHAAALALYLRHRRPQISASQRAAAAALLLVTPVIAWLMPTDRSEAFPTAVYALALGGMAGAAWTSTFPRYRVGLGAVLFVASDLLIFARTGPLAGSELARQLIWPAYYLGQFMIATGVLRALRQPATGSRSEPSSSRASGL